MKPLYRVSLLLVVFLLLGIMVAPVVALDFLREQYGWMGRLKAWLEGLSPGVDLDHLFAFGVLGAVGGLAMPRFGFWRALVCFAALGAVTELLQVAVPGRTASVSDAVLDVLGGAIGFGAVWLARRVTRWLRAARRGSFGPPPSRVAGSRGGDASPGQR